jgi:hypothetical protein
MRVQLETRLAAPFDKVAVALGGSASFLAVSRPVVEFRGMLPVAWKPGCYRVSMYLFGFLPIGWQEIGISFPAAEPGSFRLRDDGRGPLIRRWDHNVTARSEGSDTVYRDSIDIDAGLLTPIVWLFARLFFAHRQRRWRRLAKTL